MKNLTDLIDEFTSENNLHNNEGESGVKKLNAIAEALGYNESGFRHGTPLEVFLADNSGAIEAIVKWIGKQNVKEWKENIESLLPENDEFDEDADDEF